MMKKLMSLLLVLGMLLSFACAEGAQPADILSAEPWVTTAGARVTLNADGTGLMETVGGAQEFPLEWFVEGNTMTFSYELYGKRSFSFTLGEDMGYHCLFTADGNPAYYQESKLAEIQSAAGADATYYPIPMGETISLGFVNLTFDSVETTRRIGGDSGWYESQSGNNMLTLVGTMENTGNVEYSTTNIAAEFYVNGEYTLNAQVRGVANERLVNTIAPLSSCRCYIYVELPDALEGNVTDCTVRFSLNDMFKSKPSFAATGEYCFEVAMDSDALAAAMGGPVREKVFFKECPILPTPESYVDIRQSGSSSSSSNGKLTRISYSFSPYANDNIETLSEGYCAGLTADGYTVTSTGVNSYDIYDGVKHLASVTVESGALRFSVTVGNENLTERVDPNYVEEEEPMYKVGDVVKLGPLSITLEQTGTTDIIYSSITDDADWYYYYEDENGNPYFYIFGTIKNEGGVPVDIDNIYTQFEFDGTYKFSGDVAGVSKGSSHFIDDLAPLTSTNFYVFTPLPKELSNFESCVITLGADSDFSIKVSDASGLYKFERCDYVIKIDAAAE